MYLSAFGQNKDCMFGTDSLHSNIRCHILISIQASKLGDRHKYRRFYPTHQHPNKMQITYLFLYITHPRCFSKSTQTFCKSSHSLVRIRTPSKQIMYKTKNSPSKVLGCIFLKDIGRGGVLPLIACFLILKVFLSPI